ncbi:hypothetical protein DFH11DRAFT_1875661 [Phellopilus nigrolimitatus]|nr:hypothetical protein DFH11DRAFT_1875661 [Phellopilus nigrolimitatus]
MFDIFMKREKGDLSKPLRAENDVPEFKKDVHEVVSPSRPQYLSMKSFEKVKRACQHIQRFDQSTSNRPRKSSMRSNGSAYDGKNRKSKIRSHKRVRFDTSSFETRDKETIAQIFELLRIEPSERPSAIARRHTEVVRQTSAVSVQPMQAEFVKQPAGCRRAQRMSMESDETRVEPSWQPASVVLLNKPTSYDENMPVVPEPPEAHRLHRSGAQRLPAIPRRHKLLRNLSLFHW